MNPADLTVVEASAALAAHELSAVELTQACLARIAERDGERSADGDAASINAWIRIYEDEALAAAGRADDTIATGASGPLTGIPIGLKDLYGVAGKPLTASSRILEETPAHSCDVWQRLEAAGMVLLGHLHTHEFAAGGTTDQVGSPWDRGRTAGGSSGGSGAALAARMTPAATGSDTAGSLRIPSACCGTSTIKPTRNLVSLRGVVPLSYTLDHAGPMARTVADCALLLAAMAGRDASRPESAIARATPAPSAPAGGSKPLDGIRLAVSPRVGVGTPLDADVAKSFDAVLELCRRLGATLVEVPSTTAPLDVFAAYTDIFGADMLAYHRRFDDRRDLYRQSTRELLETAEARNATGWEYVQAQVSRQETTAAWSDWLAAERIAAVVEPTLPVVAPTRGWGYDHAFGDAMLIDLTHYWNWTGFPVVALPSGVGSASGLPTSVSLIGPAGSDWELLRLGSELQAELGVPSPALDASS
jgi:aspartyl-tRNA(Asn)/glutamyl-tRNA(Gln) amidotransferase subunit A